jgi:hypothetical protein
MLHIPNYPEQYETHGTVDRVSVVTDRDTGQAKGFGFC